MRLGESKFKFLLYLGIIVVINLVSRSLFFQLDFTENKIYTLSQASKNAVTQLTQPMTIRAFLTPDLPPPYSSIEQNLKDILAEYAEAGPKNFNYIFYRMSPDAKDNNDRPYEEIAATYNIPSANIQTLEKDEVSIVNAYLGISFSYGDLQESLLLFETNTNIEFALTSTLNKISRRITALKAVGDEKIMLRLYSSPSFASLGAEARDYSLQVENMVKRLNRQAYNALAFEAVDSSAMTVVEKEALGILVLNTESGETIDSGLVLSYHDRREVFNLFERGLFGGFQMLLPEDLETPIEESLETLLEINQSIAYLQGYGSKVLQSFPAFFQQANQNQNSAGNFGDLLRANYNVDSLNLESVPKNINTLIVGGPSEELSDFDLFQLDQFLMQGKSLAIFLDPFKAEGVGAYGQQPRYIPNQTGIEKLLKHYGVEVEQNYVLDKKSVKQVVGNSEGTGVEEIQFYMVPQVSKKDIQQNVPLTHNIKELVFPYVASLKLTEENDPLQPLVSSSDEAWLMSENITLDPRFTFPPSNAEDYARYALSYLKEGAFTSYFKDKEIPEPPQIEEDDASAENAERIQISDTKPVSRPSISESTEKGKLFVMGSSFVLSDNFISPEQSHPNTVFLMNVIDSLAGQDDLIQMRSKGLGFSPLREMSNAAKAFIRIFNTLILPLLMLVVGLSVWYALRQRKKKIYDKFAKRGA